MLSESFVPHVWYVEGMQKRTSRLLASFAIALCLSAVGCTGSSLPTYFNAIQVVLADYQAGKPDPQIASDLCAALGGTSATDVVCANTEIVLQDIVTYLIDTGLLSGVALDRAKTYMAAHPKTASK